MTSSSWRIWPITAAVLAVLFIGWDIHLVSQASRIQTHISREVQALRELATLSEAFHRLGLIHRVDASIGQQNWDGELDRIAQEVRQVTSRFSNEPGLEGLDAELAVIMAHCDSLHRSTLEMRRAGIRHRESEAVFQLLVQKAQKRIDRTSRKVHEQGLALHTAQLSQKWDEAQALLFAACLMAVVFALLVGMNRRLLVESRIHASQVVLAKRKLEQTNKELRQTMLSKEEKEVMIKEIHHRVKNNLQIVKSLIRFQSDQVSDARTAELFHECINRVGAMALVHEQTYLSKDLSNIDVSSYLDQLTRNLIQAYTIDTKLELDVDIRVPPLGVDTLIPLGLLINEILSNSLKYAFKGRESGRIIVHLQGTEEGGLHLRIGDDGVGMPDRNRWERPQSLGMELIHTLAEQLNARIGLHDGPGTVYELDSVPLQTRRRA